MTKAEKIDKLQQAIAKLEKGIVKISERANREKRETPMRDAFDERFSEYGPLPFAAAFLEQDIPQVSSPGGYHNMMLKAGHFVCVAATAILETPILLGRTVFGLFNGIAYKIGAM